MTTTPYTDRLNQAIQILEKIDRLEAEFAAVLNQTSAPAPSTSATNGTATKRAGKRQKMSAAAREKMAAAQRARWAKTKGSSVESKSPVRRNGKKRKSGLTPAGRAKLAAAMKARWAARKKGAAQQQ